MTSVATDAPRSRAFADDVRPPVLGHVGPNWFATVMGTGIVANAAATLPVDSPALTGFARGVWVLDAALLVVVVGATALHWHHHPVAARRHLDDPVMARSYGAVAMALMTVGAGALLVGRPVVGDTVAVLLGAVLWTTGTLFGLWTAWAVPRRAAARGTALRGQADGSWLLPVVPPMVSAATGPLLVPHVPAGPARVALQLVCTALFGLALVASAAVIALVCRRLVRHGAGPAAGVPAVWIVLGPLGQSVTAAHTITATAPGLAPVGLGYGLPVWALALGWAVLAATLTLRAAREGLPFSLGWWSFTFPVGTVVTGTSALAAATGSPLLATTAVALYAVLLAAWALVASRTAHGVWRGHLLHPPVPPRGTAAAAILG